MFCNVVDPVLLTGHFQFSGHLGETVCPHAFGIAFQGMNADHIVFPILFFIIACEIFSSLFPFRMKDGDDFPKALLISAVGKGLFQTEAGSCKTKPGFVCYVPFLYNFRAGG